MIFYNISISLLLFNINFYIRIKFILNSNDIELLL